MVNPFGGRVMPSIDMEKVNDHTWMLDIGLFGIKRVGALYLLKGERSCLIDSGTRKEAKGLIRALDAENAFPPDIIVLTHSHWDHTQGVPALCREAEKRGRSIRVMASKKAIGNLKDQSWNNAFDEKQTFENIDTVEPVEDGQSIDLGGIELQTIDLSGHCEDDIGLYDETTRTFFLGDALGYAVEDSVMFPPFMPPFWNEKGFYAAVEKIKGFDYENLCLAHYGCLKANRSKTFPDEAVQTYETWWHIFEDAAQKGKLDDISHLKSGLLNETGMKYPELEISKPAKRFMLSLLNTSRKVLGKNPINVAEVQLEGIIGWLAKGYKGSQEKIDR
jgi:glyoxylase-like metal-dependent hydrolase (beta-lactamase superfamily II)